MAESMRKTRTDGYPWEKQVRKSKVKSIGYAFAFSNLYLVVIWMAYLLVPIPRSGFVFTILWACSLIVSIVVLALFIMMFVHMLRSNIHVGRKIAWFVVLFVTSIVGSTLYYLIVYRHSSAITTTGSN